MEVEQNMPIPQVAPRRSRNRFLPSRMPPPKTTIAAAIMLIGGLTLVILGLSLAWYKDGERGLALFILGCIRTFVIFHINSSFSCYSWFLRYLHLIRQLHAMGRFRLLTDPLLR